jgi:hypothetical protein
MRNMKNKNILRRAIIGFLCCLGIGPGGARAQTVVDGVAVDEPAAPSALARSVPRATALSPSSVDFDTPKLFSDALPLRVFQTFKNGALFIGKGAVLDAESFEVTGISGTSILAFNGRTAVNGDGSVPRLPEMVLFLKPNLLGLAPKQSVSIDVGSKRDEGRTVRLLAFNTSLRVVAADSVSVTSQMQTLTVSTATPKIILIALWGDSELTVLAVDNLRYN